MNNLREELEAIMTGLNSPEPATGGDPANPTTTEIVYTWEDGREEVRYRRLYNSADAMFFIDNVLELQRQHGASCPYSFRHV